MNKVIENSLFKRNTARFQELQRCVKEFNISYNGSNIIQDDIYNILKNYATKNNHHLEIFKLPIQDDDFCAFTCIREGQLFTVINSALPISKQIFAAAHELYHIWCYISDQDDVLSHSGSFLTAECMDEQAVNREDIEANAFAGLLLVPASLLYEQIEIYDIDRKQMNLDSVVRLMDIFAVPYKAILLRLFEENIISEKTVNQLAEEGIPDRLRISMQMRNIAERWQKRTPNEIDMGVLPNRVKQNKEAGLLSESRILEDEKQLEDMMAYLLRK
ncbi:ImmA/IrrE family metallo-endopeptidase [bacterium c-19]|nr:ImmA/IrrE family metallo-endopeptidase [bacterium c-19]